MGAYDNPKLIQPVNYAEIFNRSQQNIVNTFLQYQAGERKKKEQAGKIISASQKKVSDFGKEVEEGIEGTLLGSVTNVSQEMTKEFAELERLRIRGEISNADYAQSSAGLYKNIGEMKAYNQGLEAFEQSVKEADDLSAYQEESAAVMGVLEAKKNGTLNIMFRDGKLISQVPGPGKTPDGKPIMVPFDPRNLADAKNLMVNEKLNAGEDVQAGTDLLKGLKRKTGSTFTIKTDSGEVATKQIEEYIDPQYSTEEAQINFLETNTASPISDINSLEAGSYIVDTKLRAGVDLEKNDPLFSSMLDEAPYSDEVKNKIKEQIKRGQFSKNIVINGEATDVSGFAIAYTKRSMATDAVKNFGGLQQDVTSRVIDKRTDKGDGSSFSWGSGSKKDDLNAKYIIDGLLGRGTDKSGENFLRSVLGTKRGGTQIPIIDKSTGEQKVDPETGEPMFTTINKFDKKVETDDKGKKHKYITLTLADGLEQTFDFSRKQGIKELANMLAPSFASGSTNVGNTIKAMDNYLEFLKTERTEREKNEGKKETQEETQEIDTTYAN